MTVISHDVFGAACFVAAARDIGWADLVARGITRIVDGTPYIHIYMYIRLHVDGVEPP